MKKNLIILMLSGLGLGMSIASLCVSSAVLSISGLICGTSALIMLFCKSED